MTMLHFYFNAYIANLLSLTFPALARVREKGTRLLQSLMVNDCVL